MGRIIDGLHGAGKALRLTLGRIIDRLHGAGKALRLTLGRENTREDAEYIITAVRETVEYLRSFSPVWRDLQSGKAKFIL